MKKYISIALLIVLTVSLLAGCRQNVGEETMTTDTTPSSTTTPSSSTTPSSTSPAPSTSSNPNSDGKSRSGYPSMIMD